jgi:hypothetical protein
VDSGSNLNFTIDKSSFLITEQKMTRKGNINFFPFKLDYFESELVQNETSKPALKQAKFQIKTQKYFKDQDEEIDEYFTNKNPIFQFNITVSDQDGQLNQTATVQVILINKKQRVKLVLSQPFEKVISFQEDFQAYLSNLTGYQAYIDKISPHRADDLAETNDEQSVISSQTLTDMHLHFLQSNKLG